MEFTSGYICSALTTALVKKLINPKLISYFSAKDSLYFFRRAKIGAISASLKVVNIAVSFLTATSLSATFLRNIESFFLSSPLLLPFGAVPIDGTAFTASSLVILPFLPVPMTLSRSTSFSAMIFLAAGEGVPDA